MLQKTSSVFVVYRRKTLTGSPDPTHANGTDKPCIGAILKDSQHTILKKVQYEIKQCISVGCVPPARYRTEIPQTRDPPSAWIGTPLPPGHPPPELDDHQTCKPMMVSVVSSSPTGGNFIFLRYFDANFCTKMSEMSDLCYLRKLRLSVVLRYSSVLNVN